MNPLPRGTAAIGGIAAGLAGARSWTCARCARGVRARFFTASPLRNAPPPPPPSSSSSAAAADASASHAAALRGHPADMSKMRAQYAARNQSGLYYGLSLGIATLTLAYASVPLYRAICQRTGYGGIPITDQTRFTADKLVPVAAAKRIRVTFAASVSDVLAWKFVPQQREVRVLPGETALAFYRARNCSDRDIVGVATYSVTPGQVAPYFSKIQCFCFEEQRLQAGEEVDMPVFFFIDPDFYDDPQMKGIDTVTLSYTFFKAKHDGDGMPRPLP